MSVREKRNRRRARRSSYEEVDPMTYVSNMSDVMLILAVGIMVALILHWQVPVGQTQDNRQEEQEQQEQDVVTFSDNDLGSEQEMPDQAEQIGNVYFDEASGTYYILQD